MIKKCILIMTIFSAFALEASADPTTAPETIQWNEFTALPDTNGRGGPFAGVSGGALLVAGGTNFPGAKLWDNGTKSWYDDISILPDGVSVWKTGFRLSGPARAYGVSVTASDALICVGGADSLKHYPEVTSFKWNGEEITSATLPALPRPMAYGGGVIIGDTIYVLGGISETSSTSALPNLYALNLKQLSQGWQTLVPLPGPSRILPAVAVLGGSLYVFGGSHLSPGPDGKIQREYLKDAWKYTPGSGWRQLAEMPRGAVAAPVVVPSTAGNTSILILGGDDGAHTGFGPMKDHPGFTHQVLAYDTKIDAWSDAGVALFSTLTAPVVPWKGGSLIIGGEVAPGVRTPKIYYGNKAQSQL